jgi:hypothetical protein
VATLAFQLMLVAVTVLPDCVQVAFQPWVTFWLESGNANATDQLDSAEPRFVTVSAAPNPPGHWLEIVYVAEQPVVAADAGMVIAAMPVAAKTAAALAARTAMRRCLI